MLMHATEIHRHTFAKAFGCYEMFHEKYKGIKLTVDLDDDRSNINLIFPSFVSRSDSLIILYSVNRLLLRILTAFSLVVKSPHISQMEKY